MIFDEEYYAGFWKRAGACLMDLCVLGLPTYLLSKVAIGHIYWVTILGITVTVAYFAGMESSRFQGTIGKLGLKCYVGDLDGRRITFSKAVLRHFWYLLPLIPGILYEMWPSHAELINTLRQLDMQDIRAYMQRPEVREVTSTNFNLDLLADAIYLLVYLPMFVFSEQKAAPQDLLSGTRVYNGRLDSM